MKTNFIKNKAFAIFLLFIFLASPMNLTTSFSMEKENEDKDKESSHVKKIFVGGVGATGAWLGRGLGYKATLNFAKLLYEPEPGSVIRKTVTNAHINDFIKNWGDYGKSAGIFVGACICGYAAKKAYDNYPSYKNSLEKLGNAISNVDFKDINQEDCKAYAGTGVMLLVLGWMAWDLSK